MKKILIFSTAYFPFVGGAEVAVKEITDRLPDIQFDLITARMRSDLPKQEKIGNINVHRVGFGLKTLDKFLLPCLGYWKAVGLHKKEPYGIVWSIMASQASVAAAFLKMKFSGVKLLLTLQEGDEETHLKRYAFGNEFLYRIAIKPWYLLVFKHTDYISVISNYLKERAEKIGINCPVQIVPNGVDLERFKVRSLRLKVSNQDLKNRLGIKEREKILIHTGRFVEKNGLDDLIKSLKNLPQNVKCLLLGVGPQEPELKNLAKNLGLEQRVIFLGYVSHDELPAYLQISDIFIRPSLSEGLGNSFLEAMAAGVPVIGTPVGGIPDFLRDGETGLFCEVRNPESIAEKAKLLLSDDDLCQKIIANAKKLVEEKYSWNLIAVQMREIFDKLIL